MEFTPPLPNTYWAIPGLLLGGEHPSALTADATRLRLGQLLAAGIECFLDLTHPAEIAPYDQALPFHIEYLRKPIRDHGLPERREHMMEILDCLHDALGSSRPAYVHCRAGIGRTGMVIGCLLVERGLTGEQALDELTKVWQQSERSKFWPSVPETEEQADYVRRWERHMRRAPVYPARPGGPAAEVSGAAMPGAAVPAAALPGAAMPAAAVPAAAMPAAPVPATAVPAARGPVARQPEVREPAVREPAARADSPRSGTAPDATATTATTTATATNGQSLRPAPIAPPTADPASSPDPLLDPDTLAAARTVRERFLGAMLGLATGDAVAAATQYRKPGTFTPVGDLIGGGPFELPRGGWSDDTAMALCLADSLLATESFDARDQVERYGRWQREGYLSATGQCLGITASTARALAMAQWRRQLFAGSHAPDQLDPEPLSRVAPVVLFFFAAPDDAVQFASDAARTTCQAPAVLAACRDLAHALFLALSGQPKARIMAGPSGAVAHPSEARRRETARARGNGTVTEALAIALEAFGATDNFRDAVLHAANHGDNSDVAAAACGQLAGAFYGASAIPAPWRECLLQRELIESYADRLLQHFLLQIG